MSINIHIPLPGLRKTRIAPTPSGYLHLGNILSFSITAALAQKTGAKILLRIDDMDRTRVNKAYIQDIFDTLDFMEIEYDEGPRNVREYEGQYSQLHRIDIYNKALLQLKQNAQVFACTCSRAQIQAISQDGTYPGTCPDKHLPFDTNNACWRLHTDTTLALNINTLYNANVQATLPPLMQNFVVRKKDGLAAYQLASVIDDMYYGVDFIVRGMDLWPSTLAQHYLVNILGADSFKKVTFHHHPLLTYPNGNKLSKSAGATSVNYLRKQGKKPAQIYSEIAAMLRFTEKPQNWTQLADLLNI